VRRASSLCRRQPRELALDEFEIVADRVLIAAGLVDLSQRERALVWHMHVMPEDGCSIVTSASVTIGCVWRSATGLLPELRSIVTGYMDRGTC
jgi:hypothetical protein